MNKLFLCFFISFIFSLNNSAEATPSTIPSDTAEARADKLYSKGRDHYFRHQFKEAEETFTKYLEINDTDHRVYDYLGSCNELAGKYLAALRFYQKAYALKADIDYLQHIGKMKYNLEDYRGALQDFNKVYLKNPTPAILVDRAKAKYSLQDYPGTLKDCNEAIQLYPESREAFYYRGFAKIQLGDKVGACLDWSKAGELGRDHAYELIQKNCK